MSSSSSPPPDNFSPPHSDVADMLARLRDEVRAERQALAAEEEHNGANTALERELQRCAEQLEYTRIVSAHWPLVGRNLPERMLFLVHRLVRRALRWYINPIVEQQNEFNTIAARTMRLLVESHHDLRQQIAHLQSSPSPGSSALPASPDPPDTAAASTHNDDSALPSDTPTATLQATVEQHGENEPAATFPDMTLRAFPRQLAYHQQVTAHWYIGGASALQRAAAAAQKTIRYYLRWLINPIVEQQNSFNAALNEMVGPMLNADAELRARLAALRARASSSSRHLPPGEQ